MRRLKELRRRVREGVSVDEAHSFGQWVLNSGVAKLMGQNLPDSAYLRKCFPYDGVQVEKQARELVTECCEYWVGKRFGKEGTATGADKSDLEAIDSKLEKLEAKIDAIASGKRKVARRPVFKIVRVAKGQP